MPTLDFSTKDDLRRFFRSTGNPDFSTFIRLLEHPADGVVDAGLEEMIEDLVESHYLVEGDYVANKKGTGQTLAALIVKVQNYGVRTYRLSVLSHEVTAVQREV